MNNNIQEDYCSFEVSKLLKDKGLLPYTMFGFVTTFYEPKSQSVRHYGRTGKTSLNKLIYRPTHSVAIKWIRENFGIHIFPDFGIGWEGIVVPVGYIGEGIFPNNQIDGYKSPEEATEAALLYTLRNLIK